MKRICSVELGERPKRAILHNNLSSTKHKTDDDEFLSVDNFVIASIFERSKRVTARRLYLAVENC